MKRGVFFAVGCAVCAWAFVDNAKDDAWVAARKNWWAFQAVQRPEAGRVDELVGESGPELDRARLIRRLTLDLTGLPPTPGEVQQFLGDRSADAYERLVDRLMSSPHYGERIGQKWLDVVRYADTNGFELDGERPHAWRYRDYVVASFNADKPYDRFLKEQIAGDELYPGDHAALIATGFYRAGPQHIVGGNQDEEMNRQEVLTEMTGSVGATFLGLTVGCARCHNHKFDPIPQADYYRLQAVLAATGEKDVVMASEEEKKAKEAAVKAFEARLKPIKDAIQEIEKPYRDRIREERKAKLEARHQAALEVPKDKRTEEQKVLAKEAEAQIKVSWDDVVAVLSAQDRDKRTALRQQMHRLEYERPEPVATAFAVANMEKAPATHILKVGNHKMKQEEVKPGLPRVLNPPAVPEAAAGRRTALANWLATPEHPLTARVMVNRIWQLRMGKGIVETPNDFGVLGSRPTNAKLLDWLAAEFVAGGWSVKKLDRLILMSRAYRQERAPRRLEAEFLRDSVLAVSGALNPRLGGPPVKVPIEQEVYDLIFTEGEPDNLWPVELDRREHFRRSLYLLNKRTVRLPMMANFDQPDAMTSCPIRPNSTHALQALSLFNSDFMREQSERFAERLKGECGEAECQIRRAYLHALARVPKAEEMRMARQFLNNGGSLAEFCLAMLNRNEFVYAP
jgi:hypothetical protein